MPSLCKIDDGNAISTDPGALNPLQQPATPSPKNAPTLGFNMTDAHPLNIYEHPVTTLDGQATTLADLKGRALLIVNTASKCGFTPQYKGLQALHEQYGERGLSVLGFPCNQFGAQEPGNEGEIQSFCQKNYGVSFQMFSKINVNGENTHPIFVELKARAPGLLGSQAIKWNFTKFLVTPDGASVKRFASTTNPEELGVEIEALLSS